MDAPSTVRVARAPVPFTKALYKMLVDEPESIIYDGGSLVIPNPRALELRSATARSSSKSRRARRCECGRAQKRA